MDENIEVIAEAEAEVLDSSKNVVTAVATHVLVGIVSVIAVSKAKSLYHSYQQKRETKKLAKLDN